MTAQQIDFINTIGPLIQAEAKRRGYHVASAIIAQACKESAFGTRTSGVHNYFGLKCGKYWTGPYVSCTTHEEYTTGVLTKIVDAFRSYSSMEEGVKGYFDFINTSRYANLKNCTTPSDYLTTICADGYCTSKTYATSAMSSYVIPYGLTAFDNFDTVPVVGDLPIVVGKTYTSKSDLYVRGSADGLKKKYTDNSLSANFKANAYADALGYAILKKGSRLTVKEIKYLATSTWVRIPSGWICAKNKNGWLIGDK